MVILKFCGGIFGDLMGYFSHFWDFGIWGIFWLFGIGDVMDILDISGGFFVILQTLGGIFVIFKYFFFFGGGISVSFKDFKRYYCQFGDLELFWSIWRFINIFVKDFNVIWVGLGLGPMLPCTKLKLCQYWDVIPWIKIFTN